MARPLPVPRPDTRVIHYVDTSMQADLERLTTAELATRRAQQHALYLRWKDRQAAIAERDRKARRFWTGFGAVIAVIVLAALTFGGWWLWNALTTAGLGALAIPLLIAALSVTAIGGHRCITIVEHRH
ncbi:hypothetical protein [Actinoplanes aureus]|uniref:Uncharacterized protein n=1 Tax=Actinoplanes aureus TaxID=2792083 RepID=A0A931G294_9ACTN|nr:hypothetical protein [Actinoplanes aureus]MBG0567915.1 hypothetical protein [Actinoplanes aureus]